MTEGPLVSILISWHQQGKVLEIEAIDGVLAQTYSIEVDSSD